MREEGTGLGCELNYIRGGRAEFTWKAWGQKDPGGGG